MSREGISEHYRTSSYHWLYNSSKKELLTFVHNFLIMRIKDNFKQTINILKTENIGDHGEVWECDPLQGINQELLETSIGESKIRRG